MSASRVDDRWVLCALLLAAANLRPALASLGPVLEPLGTELHLSHQAIGLLSSIPVICMGLCAPLALLLQRRAGIRHGVTFMLLLLAGGITLRLHASITVQFVSAALIGISIAALGPLLAGFTKQHFAHSARISAWSTTALCVSASLGATLSAHLSAHWHWTLALAVFALPVWLNVLWWWRVAPANRGLPAAFAQHTTHQPAPWQQARGWILLLCFGANSLVFYALLAWLPALFTDLHVPAVQAGYLLGWFALVQIIGPLWVGYKVSTAVQDRRPLLWSFAVCMLAGLLGLAHASLHFTLLWLALAGIGSAGLFAVTMVLSLDYGGDARSSAMWTTMINSGGYLIAAIGPYAFGGLRDLTHGYAASLNLLMVAALITLLAGQFLTPLPRTSQRNN